jgi:hypothetical protein
MMILTITRTIMLTGLRTVLFEQLEDFDGRGPWTPQ